MHITKQYSHATKSLALFIVPIIVFILVGLGEELTGTSLDELGFSWIYEILHVFGIAVWGIGVLFAFLSFSKKESHPKKASAGLALNLVVLLGMLGVFGNYL